MQRNQRKFQRIQRAAAAMCCCLVLLAGCRKKENSASQESPRSSGSGSELVNRISKTKQGGVITRPFRDLRDLPGTVFDVTYTPNTVKIDEGQWQKALVSISTSGKVWLFDPADAAAKQLTPGKVMFLENLAVMKVESVSEVQGYRAVVAERAGLTDLIQRGKISWKAPVRFGKLSASASGDGNFSGLREWGIVHADSGDGEDQGWHFNFSATPEEKQLNVRFKVSKEVSGLAAELSGNGHISEFMSAASMTIENGSASDFNLSSSNFSGEFDFDWAATRKQGTAAGIEESNFKLPAALITPLPIGGIPFVLKVEENFIIKPGFGGNNELAKGSFAVRFSGNEGFSVKNGNPSPDGVPDAASKLQPSTTVSIAPHAILIGMALPKLSLNLGTESGFEVLKRDIPSNLADRVAEAIGKTTLGQKAKDYFKNEASAYVQVVTVFTMTAAGAASMIPCKLERITITGQAGADLKILGVSAGDKKIELFKKENVVRQPDIKACGD